MENIKKICPALMNRDFICLGKEGEGNHLALHFDTAVWRKAYPEADILLWVTPPVGEGYFAALEEREGDAIWIVTQADTAHAGSGEIELILRDTETKTIIKSATARTLVKNSPSHAEGGDPPEAAKPWWERLLDMISGVVRTINGVKPDADGNIDIEVIGGGAKINDNTPSTSTVYSSAKIEEELDEMDRNKADKAYMVELLAELKALILAGNTEAAIAVLDQAILDNTILA
jgi:hypothetical protein